MWTISRIVGTVAATLTLGGIAAVIVVEAMSWYWVDEDILMYSILTGAVLLPATACVRAVETGRAPFVGIAGIFCGTVVLTCLLALMLSAGSRLFEEMAVLIGVVCGVSLVNCALYAALQSIHTHLMWVRIMRAVTLICGAVAAGLAIALVLTESDSFGHASVETQESLFRSFALAVIATAFLSVLTLVLNRAMTDAEEGGVAVDRRPLPVTCPRCGAPSTLQTGGDVCPACGLEIRVMLQ